MKEFWKPIKNYEGYYKVSNLGRIRSLDRKVTVWFGKRKYIGTFVNGEINRDGYNRVQLNVAEKGLRERFYVHRLVAEAFIPNLENKPFINHKDGNKLNNSIENLEWCTSQENHQHEYETGLGARGERQWKHKLNEEQVLNIRRYYEEMILTKSEIARLFNISIQNVCDIIKRKTWKFI